MISIGIEDVSKFDFLDPPPQDAIDGALRQLILLGAIECTDENDGVEDKYAGKTYKLTGNYIACFLFVCCLELLKPDISYNCFFI